MPELFLRNKNIDRLNHKNLYLPFDFSLLFCLVHFYKINHNMKTRLVGHTVLQQKMVQSLDCKKGWSKKIKNLNQESH